MSSASADWCRTLGNYAPPRSVRASGAFAAGVAKDSTPTKPSRLPDPRLPNPNVLLLQRQRQQVLPLAARSDAAQDARRPGEGRDPAPLQVTQDAGSRPAPG